MATGGGEGGTSQKYRLEFPKGGAKAFPVEGCTGRAGTWMAMRVHLWRRHMRDIVSILEEGNLPHPRCTNCDMFVLWLGPQWPPQEHRDVQGWGGKE